MKTITKLLLIMIPSFALLANGTYALFKSGALNSNGMTAGTVKIATDDAYGCTEEDQGATATSQETQDINNFTNLVPGRNQTGSFITKNVGTLDAWVRFQTNAPDLNTQVSLDYTVTVYKPNDDTNAQTSDKNQDGNGDNNSNCHTGSKGRGAGGDDKNETPDGVQYGDPLTATCNVGDDSKPFVIPKGYFAIITYNYKVPEELNAAKQDVKGQLAIKVEAVQLKNNILNNDISKGPIDWPTQASESGNVVVENSSQEAIQ